LTEARVAAVHAAAACAVLPTAGGLLSVGCGKASGGKGGMGGSGGGG